GAKLMIEEGALQHPKPDLILGFHTNGAPPDAEGNDEALGNISYTPGPAMASAAKWTAHIVGRPAHGSTPQLSIDAIVTASQVVLGLQTIHSRNVSPFDPTVLTVGILRAGERNNIIAGDAYLEGTIRTFSDSLMNFYERRMREVFDGITKAAGASYTIDFSEPYPVTVNDSVLATRFRPILERVVGSDHIRQALPHTGAEDFSYYAREVPGFFFFVGVVPKGKVSGGHHTPTFYADDQAIPVAMRAMTALVVNALGMPGK
ncbi:MAG: amidohydrolase, partial [Gemmatimonadota bacterium]